MTNKRVYFAFRAHCHCHWFSWRVGRLSTSAGGSTLMCCTRLFHVVARTLSSRWHRKSDWMLLVIGDDDVFSQLSRVHEGTARHEGVHAFNLATALRHTRQYNYRLSSSSSCPRRQFPVRSASAHFGIFLWHPTEYIFFILIWLPLRILVNFSDFKLQFSILFL